MSTNPRVSLADLITLKDSVEHFSYDSNGNLLARTVPTPANHTFAYNGVNQRVSYGSPLNRTIGYTYDKQRRLTQITKPSGKTIDYTYTGGRLSSVTTPEDTVNYSYACQNNISRIGKGSESIAYTYDGTLLTNITQNGLLNQTISYTYNNDFLPTQMTYAGQTTQLAYNKDNELAQSGAFNISRWSDYGLKSKITDGTYTQENDYNLYGELSTQHDNIITLELSRNKAGHIVKKTETLEQNKTTYTYRYDAKGRLAAVRLNRKLVEKYTYDANGNRQSATVNGTTVTASYTLDDSLQVYGDNTYRYDEDGYLIEKTAPNGTTTYSYGTLGELQQVTTPTKTITYKHNVNNQRVAKLMDGVVAEKYLWANLTTLLAIYDANDNLKQRFEYADQRMPIAMTDSNGTKYYLHYDQVGSLRAVSDTNGNVIKEIVYDTFGNILTDSNPNLKVPFGFAGGLYDPDTKLTRFGYRDYDAYTGKWMTKDPIGFGGGDSNLYGYVLGDPVGGVDPSGLVDENRIPIDDLLHDYADTINYNDIYTYAAHGVGGYLFRPNTSLQDIADRARNSGKDSIMIIACEQSKDNGDISNDAQQLANYSGMPVIFSHNYVRIIPYVTPFSFAVPWSNPWDIAYPRR